MDKYIWDIVLEYLIKFGYDSWIYINRETHIAFSRLGPSREVIHKINAYYEKKFKNIHIKINGIDGYSKIDYKSIPYVSQYCINNSHIWNRYPNWMLGFPALRIRRIIPDYEGNDYINAEISNNFSLISIKSWGVGGGISPSESEEISFDKLDIRLINNNSDWNFEGLYPFMPALDSLYRTINYNNYKYSAWLCYDEIIFPQDAAKIIVDKMIFMEMKDYKIIEELKKIYHTDNVKLVGYKNYRYDGYSSKLSINNYY